MSKIYKSKSSQSSSSSSSSEISEDSSSISSYSSFSSNSKSQEKHKSIHKKEKKSEKSKHKKKGCINVRIITPEEILKKTKEEERFINPNMINCQDLRELIEKKEDNNMNEIKNNEKIWNSLFIKNFGSYKTFENKLTNSVSIHRKRILRYLENKKKTNFKKGDKSIAYPIKRKKKKK